MGGQLPGEPIDITCFHEGLVEAAAGPCDFPAVQDRANFPTGQAAQHLAHGCESPPGRTGSPLPVRLEDNGGNISQPPLCFARARVMSWHIVGTGVA